MKTFMIVLGWIWRIAVNVVQLWVVLVVFERLQGRFENIVVAVLGLIYLAIRAVGFGNFLLQVSFAKASNHQMLRIRQLLSDPMVDEDAAAMADNSKAIDRAMMKGWVDQAFLALVWVACLFALFH